MKFWYGLFSFLALCIITPLFVSAQSASQSFTVNQFFGDPPTDPPSVPADVAAVPIASSQIDVSWSASTHVAPVVGYQVFRDLVQVATTSQTAFSDTGLQASTTYSYTVRAFDGFGNISSSSVAVATTTFALPPPPPTVAPTSTPSRPPSGRAPEPELRSFTIVPGTQSARVEFVTSVPTQYVLRYEKPDAGGDAFVQTERFSTNHSTVLIDLEPGERYVYELFIVDRYNQEVLARQGEFATEPRFVLVSPENVSNLRADTFDSDVLLRWQNPRQENFAYVRVVRNHRFFPADPNDGFIVYQGSSENYTDQGAVSEFDRQFYTVFTYDLDGNVSSGAVTVAQSFRDTGVAPSPLPDPMQPPDPIVDIPTTTPDTTIDTPTLRITDVEIIQQDTMIQAVVDSFAVQTRLPFLLRIPYDSVPQHLKVIIATIGNVEGSTAASSYRLQVDADKEYYEAMVSGVPVAGEYPIVITVYDLENQLQHTVRGVIEASELVRSEAVEESPLMAWYWGAVGFVGIVLTMLIMWLFFAYRRRGENE